MDDAKFLVVFDFDDTILHGNSDTVIYQALPNGVLPEEVKQSYVKGHWTNFMNTVFRHFEDEGIDDCTMRRQISEMQLVPGMFVSRELRSHS
jgi:pyridoxal phosphate phosphatase PHOSPHO2